MTFNHHFLGLTLLLISNISFASSLQVEVETRNPDQVCRNTTTLITKLSPYVDVELLNCDKTIKSTSLMGDDTYAVRLVIESKIQKCSSQDNQAISFNIPTNTYYHWSPPARISYIDKILSHFDFPSEIAVSNLGPITKPKYKQIVLIPKCAFK